MAHHTLYGWYKNNNNNKTGVAFKVRYDIYHFKALIFVFKEFYSSSVHNHIWAKGNDNNKHKFRIIFNHSTTIILSYMCLVWSYRRYSLCNIKKREKDTKNVTKIQKNPFLDYHTKTNGISRIYELSGKFLYVHVKFFDPSLVGLNGLHTVCCTFEKRLEMCRTDKCCFYANVHVNIFYI